MSLFPCPDFVRRLTEYQRRFFSEVGHGHDDLEQGIIEAFYSTYPLNDVDNISGIASHFLDNDDSYPEGWNEIDVVAHTYTNKFLSEWMLVGGSSETSYKYNIRSLINIELTNENQWNSFSVGPMSVRDGLFVDDVDYYIGVYGDNSGTIDENIFNRIHLQWNSTAGYWQVRGECKDGTTQQDGDWYQLPLPLIQPFVLRFMVRNTTGGLVRQYFSYTKPTPFSTDFLLQSVTNIATWGNIWVQINQTRGGGIQDYLSIDAIDYQINNP